MLTSHLCLFNHEDLEKGIRVVQTLATIMPLFTNVPYSKNPHSVGGVVTYANLSC